MYAGTRRVDTSGIPAYLTPESRRERRKIVNPPRSPTPVSDIEQPTSERYPAQCALFAMQATGETGLVPLFATKLCSAQLVATLDCNPIATQHAGTGRDQMGRTTPSTPETPEKQDALG